MYTNGDTITSHMPLLLFGKKNGPPPCLFCCSHTFYSICSSSSVQVCLQSLQTWMSRPRKWRGSSPTLNSQWMAILIFFKSLFGTLICVSGTVPSISIHSPPGRFTEWVLLSVFYIWKKSFTTFRMLPSTLVRYLCLSTAAVVL